jgi:hypothetical protein
MKLRYPLATGLLLAVFAGSAPGQCAIAVDNADPMLGGGNPLPFQASYTPELTYQILLPRRFLPRNALTLVDLEFTATTPATFSSTDFVLKLAHASLATDFPLCSLWSNNADPWVTVQSGAFMVNLQGNAWTPLGLNASWGYDGVRDILVEIRWRNATGGTTVHNSDLRPINAYAIGAGAYGATACSHGIGVGARVRARFREPTIRASGTMMPGSAITLPICSPGQAGKNYYMGASLGTQPGIPLPNGATLPLNFDGLLIVSLVDPFTFSGFQGVLDPNDAATATVNLPPSPGLRGLTFFVAFLTIDAMAPGQIGSVSSAAPLRIL